MIAFDRIVRHIPVMLAFCAILLLAGYMRFVHVADNPAWYTDEGTHISIAHHLLQGRVQYFAVTDSMLVFARPPLFHACLAVVSAIFGEGITTLRRLTAGLGVVATALVFTLAYVFYPARKDLMIGNKAGFALWVAFLYAVYPQAILYTRFGFSYALLTPLVLLIALLLTRHIQTGRWNSLALAGILAGIGLLGDIMMGAIIIVVGVITLFRSPNMLIWLLPLMALPFGIYAGILGVLYPSALFFDLNFTLNRLGGIPIARQLNTIAENLTMLLSTDLWFPLGMVGIFLIQPPALRVVCIALLLLPIIIIGRTVALFHLSLYYMSPLFPLLILGVASLTWTGGAYVISNAMTLFQHMRYIQQLPIRVHRLLAGGMYLLLIGAPLIFINQHTLNGIHTRIQTAIDPFLVDSADGEAVIAYFEAQDTADKLILASPSIGWALEMHTSAHVADWQMHIAYIGYDAVHLPHDLPHERYAFIPTIDHADYVVIDNIWRNWGNVHIPQAVVLYQMVVDTWKLVYRAGTLDVYARP